ncbi:hypothetical protein ACRAVF_18985 [Bradyrhizobium oligotrophicum S58]
MLIDITPEELANNNDTMLGLAVRIRFEEQQALRGRTLLEMHEHDRTCADLAYTNALIRRHQAANSPEERKSRLVDLMKHLAEERTKGPPSQR